MPTPPRIAVFANRDSLQAAAIGEAIAAAGGAPVLLDIRLGGVDAPTVTMGDGLMRWGGVDFADIRSIHVRCTAYNTPPTLPPVRNAATDAWWRHQFLREQEQQATALAFLDQLQQLGRLVVNPLTVGYPDHDAKGQFYQRLSAHGFPAPRTLTTNDPHQAARFIQEVGQAVVKPAIGVGSTREATLTDAALAEVASCPVMFQERLRGDTLRVHIVGDRVVLALRIATDGGIDSRSNTRQFTPIRMADAEAARIVAANRLLGLHYAAWDVIDDPDWGLVYLDCNPGPYVMWIGPENYRLVFQALAHYLLTFARK